MSKLVNFIGFQVCWFACVLGAANELEWLGPLCVALWSIYAVRCAPQRRREALALVAVGLLGALVGVVELGLGWLEFRGTQLVPALAPAWILALWIVFASTFASSLAWITSRPWLNAGFALFGAPLSYLGGERLGSLTVLAPRVQSLIGVGVLWALALPLAAWIYARIRSR